MFGGSQQGFSREMLVDCNDGHIKALFEARAPQMSVGFWADI